MMNSKCPFSTITNCTFPTMIKNSIKSGTKKRWDNSNGAVMPAFKQLPDEDLEVLAEWISPK